MAWAWSPPACLCRRDYACPHIGPSRCAKSLDASRPFCPGCQNLISRDVDFTLFPHIGMTESQRSAEHSLTETPRVGDPGERQADLHPPHPPSPGTEEDKDRHDLLAAWTAESSSTEGQPQLRVNAGKMSRRSISDFRRSELETHTLNSWDKQPASNPSNSSSAGEGKTPPPKGRHKKRWPKVPFLRRPLSGDGRPWLQHRQEASPWVNLFSGS